jgi:hypothetical protein
MQSVTNCIPDSCITESNNFKMRSDIVRSASEPRMGRYFLACMAQPVSMWTWPVQKRCYRDLARFKFGPAGFNLLSCGLAQPVFPTYRL